MPRYTTAELADIHFVYGFCNGNSSESVREYGRRFPNRRCPDSRTFRRVHMRLRERGTSNPNEGESSGNVQHSVSVEEEILNLVSETPTISTRRVALMLGVSQTKVWRVLRKENLHPYHYVPAQELLPADLPKRADFCRLMLLNEELHPTYFSRILWTDEASFTREGVNNFHNLHMWASENPHLIRESSFQQRFSVNVWAGIIGNTFIGPVILPNRLNSSSYLNHLEVMVDIIADEVPLNVRNNLIFQHDGAPAHYGRIIKDWLDQNYPGRWIGRNGPILWPARSPDLTPLDFYVWGYLKTEVYSVKIDTIEQLRERILSASSKIRQNLVTFQMPEAIKRRLMLCLLQNGAHFENLL